MLFTQWGGSKLCHNNICKYIQIKLEQLERQRSENTPAAHDYPYYWPVDIGSQVKTRQSQSYKFKEFAKTLRILKKKNFTRDTPSEVAW